MAADAVVFLKLSEKRMAFDLIPKGNPVMDQEAFKVALRDLFGKFSSLSLSPRDFVNLYEDLLADEMPEDIDGRLYTGLDELIMWTALYSGNVSHRAECPALIDEPELRSRVRRFLDEHGNLLLPAGRIGANRRQAPGKQRMP